MIETVFDGKSQKKSYTWIYVIIAIAIIAAIFVYKLKQRKGIKRYDLVGAHTTKHGPHI